MNKLIRWAPYMSFPLSSTGCPAHLSKRPPAPTTRLPDVLCEFIDANLRRETCAPRWNHDAARTTPRKVPQLLLNLYR